MSNGLFSREEALTGFTARRAHALLFLIENRTAHLVAQASQVTEFVPSEIAARDRDWAFFQVFTLSRQPPLRPTIQDLERYASEWAYLAPENPMLRATIAHLLGEKYEFTEQAVLGLGSDGHPGFRLTTLQGDREIRVEDLWSATDLNHRLDLYVLRADQERVQAALTRRPSGDTMVIQGHA